MVNFLKVFLRGLLCTVLLPIILAVWVLYAVYCLFAFLVMFVKGIIVFFAGGSAAGELPEDIEAKRILLEAEQAKVEEAQAMSMMYQGMANMMQNGMQPAMGQPMQQPEVQQGPAPAQFNPEETEPVQEESFSEPVSSEDEQINEEGGNDDGQSY